MAEPDDKRELSGLARSIDALFATAPGVPPSDAVTVPMEAVSAPERPEADLPETPVEQDAGPPETLFTPTADGPTDPWGESPPAEPEPPEAEWGVGARTGEYYTADWVEEQVAGTESAEPEAFSVEADAAAMDVPEAEAPQAEPTSGPEPDALERAVDAFLAGSPGAAAEVAVVAAGLQERLALDPLADAVERLVREAGEPPDPTLLDMAKGIIDPAVASRIVQRIGHEHDEERLAEYTVLCRRLDDIVARAFRGALTGATESAARRTYYDMLIAMSDSCRPLIEEMVEDENTLLVRSGLAILSEIGGARAVELVTSGLVHPDKRVRSEALLSLAKLEDEESSALVLGFLDEPERDVRVAAATAAGKLRLERALRPLLAQLEAEGDGEGAIPFIDALGELGDPGAVPALEKHAVKTLFSKPRPEVRVAAYRALHRIGTPHARELVQKVVDSKEPGVWAAVRQIVAAERDS